MAKYVVRYGAMRFLGVCSAHSSAIYCRDARVIARTERGLEAAVVLGEADRSRPGGVERSERRSDPPHHDRRG